MAGKRNFSVTASAIPTKTRAKPNTGPGSAMASRPTMITNKRKGRTTEQAESKAATRACSAAEAPSSGGGPRPAQVKPRPLSNPPARTKNPATPPIKPNKNGSPERSAGIFSKTPKAANRVKTKPTPTGTMVRARAASTTASKLISRKMGQTS